MKVKKIKENKKINKKENKIKKKRKRNINDRNLSRSWMQTNQAVSSLAYIKYEDFYGPYTQATDHFCPDMERPPRRPR